MTFGTVTKDHSDINTEELRQFLAQNLPLLNQDQRIASGCIVATIDYANGECLFIDGPGGTGNTFLCKVLLVSHACTRDMIALSVAFSGIAATLLHEGRTAHSRFKIPVEGLDEH